MVVVGSYTRMFLGPLRGTECGNIFFFNYNKPDLHSYPVLFTHVHGLVHTVMSSITPAQLLTCLSSITDSGSLAIAVQGNHSNVVRSVWEQLLQQGCGGGAWYQNLHRDAKHVRDQHSSKCTDFTSKTMLRSVKSKKDTMNSYVYFQTRKKNVHLCRGSLTHCRSFT